MYIKKVSFTNDKTKVICGPVLPWSVYTEVCPMLSLDSGRNRLPKISQYVVFKNLRAINAFQWFYNKNLFKNQLTFTKPYHCNKKCDREN